MRLSTPMREALEAAARNPLRRTHDTPVGKPPWPAPASTLAALVRHGLLERIELRNRRAQRVDQWTITTAGVEALNPPPRYRPDRPLFMAHGAIRYRVNDRNRWEVVDVQGSSDYTTSRMKAIDDLEVMEADRLASFAHTAREREQERRMHSGHALDAQQFDTRLEQVHHAARVRRMDVTSQTRLIRHMADQGRDQKALQRLVRIEAQLQLRAA